MGSSGTGFYVNSEGSVLTNVHVVEGCRNFLADEKPAKLGATSAEYDSAILNLIDPSTRDHAEFAVNLAHLNTAITVGGCP